MPYMGVSVLGRAVAAAAVVVAGCGAAFGQTAPYPSPGSVEFRWRERSTSGYNGGYTLGPGAVPATDAVPTPDPSASSVTSQDATVVLVLEAKVTRAAWATTTPVLGLFAAGFDIVTNQTSGGAFARQNVVDGNPGLNPRANARVNASNLGFSPGTLLGHSASHRGIVAPFRNFAGSSANGPAVGMTYNDPNRISKATFGLQTWVFEDPDDPGQPVLVPRPEAGMDTWVPIYIAIYNITDTSTQRDIVFTFENSPVPIGQIPVTDYNLRGWVAAPSPDGELWRFAPGFVTPPTFTVHAVPGPGAMGVLGLGVYVALRRRR